jgi:serine/threonine-protein kinase
LLLVRRSTPHVAAAVVGTVLCLGAPGAADAQSRASDVAAAQALFDEGRQLVKAGRFAEACPKFEESDRLDAGPGTEFNLADCYERAGRTASAWAEFSLVADSLRALGQRDRERFARERAGALEPKLTKLLVNVPAPARVAGLEVKRDGEVLREAQWGSGVPVDPGRHTVGASAPGKLPSEQTMDVVGEGKTVVVDVPVLADPPVAPVAAPVIATAPAPVESARPSAIERKDPSPSGLAAPRIVALVAGGVGIVGLGLGGYFGSQAISNHNDYAPLCPGGRCTTEAAVQAHDSAATDATLSTVAFAAGAAALAGGIVLWFLAPPRPSRGEVQKPGLRVVPSAGPRESTVSLAGSW